MITSRLDWLKTRRKYIGSSDAPVLMLGEVHGTTIMDLWKEKTSAGEITDENSREAERGHVLEPFGIQWCQEWFDAQGINQTVQAPKTDEERWNKFGYVSVQYPFLATNLDGRTNEAVVEAKFPRYKVFWKIKKEGVIPRFYAQIQHQLIVTDLPYAWLVVGHADFWGEPHVIRVARDEEYCLRLLEREALFWEFVLDRKPPSAEFLNLGFEL